MFMAIQMQFCSVICFRPTSYSRIPQCDFSSVRTTVTAFNGFTELSMGLKLLVLKSATPRSPSVHFVKALQCDMARLLPSQWQSKRSDLKKKHAIDVNKDSEADKPRRVRRPLHLAVRVISPGLPCYMPAETHGALRFQQHVGSS